VGVNGGTLARAQIWAGIKSAAGAVTVDVPWVVSGTPTASTFSALTIMEYSGAALSGFVDGSGGKSEDAFAGGVGGGTPTVSSTSITTTAANDLVVALCIAGTNVNAGATANERFAGSSWNFECVEDYLDVGAAGTKTVQFRAMDGANLAYLVTAAAFKLASGGGGGAPFQIITNTNNRRRRAA
jgi:hypothetical protein